MNESKLKAKQGPDLFQQEMALGSLGEPAARPRGRRLPHCPECRRFGLEEQLLAAPGGGWKCGRGHGPIE